MHRFTEEQIKAVVEELQKRSKQVKQFEADTHKERLTFIGYAEAYEKLALEIERLGGLEKWD